jgi:predicted nucleotidyltransferase
MKVDQRIIDKFNENTPFTWDECKLISLCLIGSHSHGTHIPNDDPNSVDDTDYTGIILPPVRYIVGLPAITRQGMWDNTRFQYEELDVIFYSLPRYLELLTKSNPNVLGLMWMNPKNWLYTTPEWELVVQNRKLFNSRHKVYHSFKGTIHKHFMQMSSREFNGYMGDKRKRIVEKYGFDVKDAAHTIRLSRMTIEFLNTGRFNVDRTGIDAEFLKSVKQGEVPLEEIIAMQDSLFREMDKAYATSTLPILPDSKAIGTFVEQLMLTAYNWQK